MNWVQSFEIISKILKFLDYKIGSLILRSQGQKLVSKGDRMNHDPWTTSDNMDQGSQDASFAYAVDKDGPNHLKIS